MGSHLTATGHHLPYGITQCYLPPDTSERAQPGCWIDQTRGELAYDVYRMLLKTRSPCTKLLYLKNGSTVLHEIFCKYSGDSLLKVNKVLYKSIKVCIVRWGGMMFVF